METRHTPRAYGVMDAAKELGIGRSSVYSLINSGRLRTVKLGRRTLIPADAIDALIQAQD